MKWFWYICGRFGMAINFFEEEQRVMMAIDRDPIFRGYAFDADIILLCVRWYISYRLTYRDSVEIMAERGVRISHTTILRWTRFVSEFIKRWDAFRRPAGASWRVDETYVSIRGRRHYLYRAVDQRVKTTDFLLRNDRGIAAAQAFFRKALTSNGERFPRKITLDGHVPSRVALWRLRRERIPWCHVKVRTSQYLNNLVEQDHRGVKARLRPTKGLKSLATAAITIAGFELARRIRKRQFNFKRRGHRYARSRQIELQIALA